MKQNTVCILTSVHPARDIRIYEKEAKTLAEAGYQVVLVNQFEEGQEEDVAFIKAGCPSGRVGRILLGWMIYFWAGLKTGASVCHFHDPELIPAGLLLRLMGRKVIYDVHEDLPRQLLYKPYLTRNMRRGLSWLAERVEGFSSRFFSANICATEVIARRFPRSEVVYNYPLCRELESYRQYILPYDQRKDQLCYVGAISENRGVFNILNAAEYTDLSVKMAGRFEDENLMMRCKIHWGYKNVEFLGYLGREEVLQLMGESKAGLLLLEPTQNYLWSLPIKLFEYLMAGAPVICSDFPYWRRLLGDCALFVNPSDPKAVRQAAAQLLNHPQQAAAMARKGQKLVEEKYIFEQEAEKLLAVYENLMK